MRTTARLRYSLAGADPDAYEATWRADAWQDVGVTLHKAVGTATVGPERFTAGAPERLVLALLRRAAPAFPDAITHRAWPVFPELPDIPIAVDHLAEGRTTASSTTPGSPTW